MMYMEYEQEFIDELQREIGSEHPLYRRDVFAIAVRRDPDAVIFQTADGEIYAIVHLIRFPAERFDHGWPKFAWVLDS